MKITEAIKKFLIEKSKLNELYNEEMEVQVNVGQDGGTKITGKTQEGYSWWGYSDQNSVWKPIRIPYSAKDDPNFPLNKELKFSTEHFEAIGLTGWNWIKKESNWVGFDFDSILSHTKGLSDDELQDIRRMVKSIPWITIRRSTSGKGLHLYVYLLPAITTENHTEHAALGRSILGMVSAKSGIKLESSVDTCGGVLWIWHRRQIAESYQVIKEATESLNEIPLNWKEHIEVINKKRNKIKTIVSNEEYFENLVNKQKIAKLDSEHQKLLMWLAKNECLWWWDSDRNMLVCHTFDLLNAHRELNFKGPFFTIATGKGRGEDGKGNDQNCFAFPIREGSWVIRRHTQRTQEHPSWSIDSGGWTRCYYNCPADFATVARCYNASERSDGKYTVSTVDIALQILKELGAITEPIENWLNYRPAQLKQLKDGRVVVFAQKYPSDQSPNGWAVSKDGKQLEKVVSIQESEKEQEIPDDFMRHLITGGVEAGWYFYTRGMWIEESIGNIKQALMASGVNSKNTTELMGQCVLHPWILISQPFQPEYPGNRIWNRRSPQINYEPKEGDYPTWTKILNHCGEGLTDAVLNDKWCREYGILTGEEYLFIWVSSLFQFPTEPLPYLFFHGPFDSGKSTFHEALSLLIKNKVGYVRADVALTSQGRFNAELLNSVLCVVEETNLRTSKDAYNRIKDWVTGRTILIHQKGETPYEITNTTHWIQVNNDIDACPTFPGDTRIVVSYIDLPEEEIPKYTLLRQLEVEAPAFTYAILNKEIPPTPERLRIPVIATADKMLIEYSNEDLITQFFRQRVYECSGNVISLADLYDAFYSFIPNELRKYWSRGRFIKQLPRKVVTGRWGAGGYFHAGNIALEKKAAGTPVKRLFDKLI